MREPILPASGDAVESPGLDEPWDGWVVSGDLAGATGWEADIARCRLEGVSLTGAQVDGGRVTDTVFRRCELSASVWDGVFFDRVRFEACRVAAASMAGCRFRDVRFVDCRGEEVNLRAARGERVWLEECGLPGLDLYGAELAHARFVRCDLTGAQVTKAKLAGAWLHGSVLEGLRGPLTGVVIGSDQVLPVAYGLLAAASIVIDDDPSAGTMT